MDTEAVRRCEDCHRVVHGHAGNACPFCGGERLVTFIPHPSHGLHHPSVLTLAVTFCGGLILIHLAANLLVPQWLPMAPGYRSLVEHLQVIIGVATALYLVLRRGEGDFRALFAITFGLFLTTEGLDILARGYSVLALNDMAKPFNIALFIFSSLALTAAIADGRRRDPYHLPLVMANTGFLFLSALRGGIEMRGRELNENAHKLITVAFVVVVLGVAVALLRGEIRAHPRTKGQSRPQVPSTPQPDPGAGQSEGGTKATGE
jgi:hypothetical protein